MKTISGHALTRLSTCFVVMLVVTTILASISQSPLPRGGDGAPSLVAEAFGVVRPSTRFTRSSTVAKSSAQQHGLFLSSSKLSNNNKDTPTGATTTRTSLYDTAKGSAEDDDQKQGNRLNFLLDPGTKGGAVFLSILLFLVPIVFYNIILATMPDVDPLDVGKWIGAGFTILATLAWVSTYIFRVATKDMTYAKQLKDYENAVIAKRLEELDEDELQALVEEVERDDF